MDLRSRCALLKTSLCPSGSRIFVDVAKELALPLSDNSPTLHFPPSVRCNRERHNAQYDQTEYVRRVIIHLSSPLGRGPWRTATPHDRPYSTAARATVRPALCP